MREGTPCHLYFDLEFVPELNPGFDGPASVVTLVELVRQGMRSVATRVLCNCHLRAH